MRLLDRLAEEKIHEAIDRGDDIGLARHGKPLKLENDPLIPEALRMAYKILKNAGYVPEEVRLRREISEINQLLEGIDAAPAVSATNKRLHLLLSRLGQARGDSNLEVERAYYEELNRRLAGRRSSRR